jgi:hypothetical protein
MVSNPTHDGTLTRDSALLQILNKVDAELARELDVQTGQADSLRAGRGRPNTYPEILFLKAVLLMTILKLNKIHELLTTIEQNTHAMRAAREHLLHDGRRPDRRTFERRCARLTRKLPDLIAKLAARILQGMDVFANRGRAVAMDSTVLRAKDGAVWHKKHKDAGVVPHSRIDTEAGWTKSGWHGWVYGWKLHVACAMGPIWLPLCARLTPANVHDAQVGEEMARDLPGGIGLVLGDTHYNAPGMRAACHLRGMELMATRSPAESRKEPREWGKEVRSFFGALRSKAVENFNEHFKAIFDVHGDVPTKGEMATTRFALSAVMVYQLGVWLRHEAGLSPCQGLKPFLRAL